MDKDQPERTENRGCLGYTAPEISLGQPYGVEVDMFSAGVIIFLVLSGHEPFLVPGESRTRIEQRTKTCDYRWDEIRWNLVSTGAKHLVRSLLVPRERRLTAAEALEHEWFRVQDNSRDHQQQQQINFASETEVAEEASVEQLVSDENDSACSLSSMQRWYNHALANGKARLRRVRLMVSGPFGVGKTSLVRSLLGQPFESAYDSTEGINIETNRLGQVQSF